LESIKTPGVLDWDDYFQLLQGPERGSSSESLLKSALSTVAGIVKRSRWIDIESILEHRHAMIMLVAHAAVCTDTVGVKHPSRPCVLKCTLRQWNAALTIVLKTIKSTHGHLVSERFRVIAACNIEVLLGNKTAIPTLAIGIPDGM